MTTVVTDSTHGDVELLSFIAVVKDVTAAKAAYDWCTVIGKDGQTEHTIVTLYVRSDQLDTFRNDANIVSKETSARLGSFSTRKRVVV